MAGTLAAQFAALFWEATHDPVRLHSCDLCSAIAYCAGCLAMHKRHHAMSGLAAPLRPVELMPLIAIAPLAIPRRHLAALHWHTDQDDHTCNSNYECQLIAARALLGWHNLMYSLTLRLEVHRAAQLGLLRICRPFQLLPLKPPGLPELILQFVGANLPPTLVKQALEVITTTASWPK